MTSSHPARTAARRTQPTVYSVRRRRGLLGATLAALLAAAAFAGAGHPLNGEAHPLNGKRRAYLSPVRWPQRDQAALDAHNYPQENT